jgi:hypothetical protein
VADPLIVRWGGPGEYLAVGKAGWAYVGLNDPTLTAWVRLREEANGRLVVGDLVVGTVPGLGGVVTGRRLTQVRLGRIEAAVNTPSNRERLRSHVQVQRNLVRKADPTLFAAKFAPVHTGLSVTWEPRAKLDVSDRGKRPDDFYRRVAELHAELGSLSPKAAQLIADANEVPVSTVYRWLKEARRRGLLPPGRRQRQEEE